MQVEGDVKLEEMDGEDNPVDMRNVFPPNTAKQYGEYMFHKYFPASSDWPELGTIAKVLIRYRDCNFSVLDPSPVVSASFPGPKFNKSGPETLKKSIKYHTRKTDVAKHNSAHAQ